MSSRHDRETMLGFLQEVGDSLPAIRQGVETYAADSSKTDALYEAFRLTHSLKGGASVIGFSAFSHALFRQEEVLNSFVESTRPLDGETRNVVLTAVEAFERYAAATREQTPNRNEILNDVIRAFRRYHGLPEEGDYREISDASEGSSPLASDASPREGAENASNGAASPEAAGGLDENLAAFRHEADDHLAAISTGLSGLAERGEFDAQAIDGIRRHVHSLKGSAGAIGQNTVALIAHHMEDRLEQWIENQSVGSQSQIELVLTASDVLAEVCSGQEDKEIVGALLEQFAVGRDETNAEAPPAAVFDDFSWIRLDEMEEVSPELLGVYREEAEDHLKAIYAALRELEEKPGDRDLIQQVRRPAHTLKGAAGAVGLQVVTKLAHRMEDLLDRLYDENATVSPLQIKLLYSSVDCLTELSEGGFDHKATTTTIVELFRQFESEAPSSPTKASGQDESAQTSDPVDLSEIVVAPRSFTQNAASNKDEETTESSKKAAEVLNPDQVLRVPLERLDDIVRTVSELIINRTAFEQRMQDFGKFVEELQLTISRLRQTSNELETRYGVNALGKQRFVGGDGEFISSTGGFVKSSRFEEFDSLEFDRYTNFHLISRALSETTADINTISGELRNLLGDFDSLLTRQGRLSRDTQDRLMRIRMVPFAHVTTRLHRVVRGVARQQDKLIDLVVEGESVELDKNVLEEIVDPLMHLLRNAADHGVEPPALRMARGKTERATIRLKASYQGTQVVILVEDDGAGIDTERVRQKAVEKGIITASQAESLSTDEVCQLIFVPGFSTAAEVSEISGRGVGMDIVKHKVQRLKGTIQTMSVEGEGTTFTIRLPMTMAVTRALMVVVGNSLFAIPMQAVTQILRVDRTALEKMGRDRVVRVGGELFPVSTLAQQLGIASSSDESNSAVPMLLVNAGDQEVAVCIDRVIGGRDIVVKTLGTHLRHVKGIIGATLMGDGAVVPILDPAELGAPQQTATPKRHVTPNVKKNTSALRVMIVDDSVSVRRVMANLVTNAGWTPFVAKDGVDALEQLHSGAVTPDVFLLDIEMPRMDGYELLSALRAQDAYRRTPVVMITSRAGGKHRDKAIALGADDYIVKPYQDETLLATIRRLAGAQQEVATP